MSDPIVTPAGVPAPGEVNAPVTEPLHPLVQAALDAQVAAGVVPPPAEPVFEGDAASLPDPVVEAAPPPSMTEAEVAASNIPPVPAPEVVLVPSVESAAVAEPAVTELAETPTAPEVPVILPTPPKMSLSQSVAFHLESIFHLCRTHPEANAAAAPGGFGEIKASIDAIEQKIHNGLSVSAGDVLTELAKLKALL